MGVFQRMLSTQALMFVYMLVGVVIVRAGILKPEGRSSFIGLLINVTLPCMILNAFMQDAGLEALIVGGRMLLISAACTLSSWGLGRLLWRNRPPLRRAALEFATMFSNAGNAGLPVLNLVFGPEGVFYGSMYLIPPRILQWTVGMGFFLKRKKGMFVKNVLLNPMVVVVYIGFALMAFNWQIPGVFGTAIARLGDMTAPLSMILIGATLSHMRPKALIDPAVLFAKIGRAHV